MQKKVLIFGITGQDGSYLSELLLEKNYEVHGVIRRSSSFNTRKIDHIYDKLKLHYGDVTDPLVISNLLDKIRPDEVYNLAAQSHVQVSFEIPYYTGQVDAIGTLNILEAIKNHCPKSKFYQASTSELFGKVQETPQKETTPFYPRSPYGVAKLYGYWIVKNFREAYGMFACNGILFNHESPRRGLTFVTRKITSELVRIKYGDKTTTLKLGNLEAQRDWGHAKEYVEGMWRMLQQNEPEDFVLATGKLCSVRQFIELAAKELDYEIEWIGDGIDEKGYDKITGKLLVEIDPKYFRPTEVDLLLGDATKAKEKLGWEPKIKFEDLVKEIIKGDIEQLVNYGKIE